MTDKRSESERVSARTPVPSIAPPTDEIDAEWGADELPSPAPLPKLTATASTPAPRPSASPAARIPTPIPRPSSAPRSASPSTPEASRPSASSTPLVPASTRPSAISTPLVPASGPPSATATPLTVPSMSSATATPLINPTSARRSQTLLGMAPVIPPRASEPAAAATPVPKSSEPARSPAVGTPLVATPSTNPLRKQTLLGIAPTVAAKPAAVAAEPSHAAETSNAEPVADQASSMSSIVTVAVAVTDAPTTSDVTEPTAIEAKKHRVAAPAVAALSSHDDLPELQPRRPRWLLPLGVAAAIGLGVVGLRQLDRAPTQVPEEPANAVNAAKAPLAAAKPQNDDGDLEPGPDSAPRPMPTEPEPLDAKAKGGDAKPAADAPSLPAASATGAEGTSPAATAGVIRIQVESDPPGARMFWKGKEVGTTPFVLQLQPGERHAYELGLPGYTTRKVVIDGSKTDIKIGLRPVPAATSGGTRRK